MRFPGRHKRPPPGEYPESFTRAFVRITLPAATPAEARSTVEYLRRKGWSEVKLAQYVLPYMPREDGRGRRGAGAAGGGAAGASAGREGRMGVDGVGVGAGDVEERVGGDGSSVVGGAGPSGGGVEEATAVPAAVSRDWLDRQLPAMTARQIRLVVEELEGRGWPTRDVALAVLPHLLPKLSSVDADAILAGLRELGVSDEDLALASPRR